MTAQEIFNVLLNNIKKYHPSQDFSMVEKAFEVANTAHGLQLRKSGEPYIIHPLQVAVILSELEMDRETINAGILHDVIEDTIYSYTDIVNLFGEEVAQLVDGVTKLEKLKYSSKEEAQAENYRKLFLSMSNDIRVIIIKLADRLHNLRTLEFMTEAKQKEIAQETLDIYAPLAHRLGISKIRYELEDLSFRYLHPESFFELEAKIKRKQSEREDYVSSIVSRLRNKLAKTNLHFTVEGRPKHFFSIYKKMYSQNKTLDEIYDLFAVRVIVDDAPGCYMVLGLVHEMWMPIQGRFKDYIAMPKTNKYQSLHNTLIGPNGEPFEIQIRTREMHKIAEYGVAAHWKYKEGDTQMQNDLSELSDSAQSEAKLSWLRQILEWQRELSDNREYLDTLKFDLNVYKENVYCFSPKGEVISLLAGATPVDFAYAIHSAVGNRMVGAKINNKIVPIDTTLVTGDRVEILTSQNTGGPKRDWLKIVKTSQAKGKINQWFKKENKEENMVIGKEMLEKGAKKKGYTLSDLMANDRFKVVLNRFSLKDWDSVCASVGHGGLKEGQVINRLEEEYVKQNGNKVVVSVEEELKQLITSEQSTESTKEQRRSKNGGIIIKGLGDVSARFSKCCSPVPGDEIVGFVTRGRGVSVHRTDCVNMLHLDDLDRNRLIDAEWGLPDKAHSAPLFRADIRICCGESKMCLISDVSAVFAAEKISIINFEARSSDCETIFHVTLNISSKEQLEAITKKLLKVRGIDSVERFTT